MTLLRSAKEIESCMYLFEPKPINSIPELCPMDLVIVTNWETPRQIARAGFDYLLGGPPAVG